MCFSAFISFSFIYFIHDSNVVKIPLKLTQNGILLHAVIQFTIMRINLQINFWHAYKLPGIIMCSYHPTIEKRFFTQAKYAFIVYPTCHQNNKKVKDECSHTLPTIYIYLPQSRGGEQSKAFFCPSLHSSENTTTRISGYDHLRV